MHISFSTLLAFLSIASTSILALPASSNPLLSAAQHPNPFPGMQPGCGPQGCHNPTGAFGLHRSNHAYHTLCDQHAASAAHDHRAKACFDTLLKLDTNLSAPNPSRLQGYIDGSGTNFVLFAGEHGQIVTLDEQLEIHVDQPRGDTARKHGCARVRIYRLPKWSLELDETWCAGYNEPIQL
ncbi:hypothetical protein EX895_001726 [Sporisorium graminicola]|uniref:Uncharacterized protein n=1 Tax=Sporisorium graminicola TaxID=280036 RepID=A0A4U7KWR1_9BASI|nr:hypothetical protein EX895_001726 [Sporisorium graminicola]TKY89195.1 hypothetical protein EX895_001726 [Sporisorium graminicola]